MMMLRWINGQLRLLAPADSTGSPSGPSGGRNDGETRLPAGSAIPTERNDGRHEDTEVEARGGDVDWGEMHEQFDQDDDDTTATGEQPAVEEPGDGEEPPAPAQKPKAQEQKPAPTPGKEQLQQGDEPSDQQPAPGDEQQGDEPAQAQEPKQETPEEKAAREKREAEEEQRYTQQLEEYYQIPEELAARLATEPEKVLPVLAAKVHRAVEVGMRSFVSQQLPIYLQHFQRITEAESRTKAAFYQRWPSLAKHEAQVKQVGEMYRKMNPKATSQEALEKIGALACAALGITPDLPPDKRGNGQARPTAPARSRPPQRPAVRPAGVGASQAGTPPPSDNIWENMADELLEEDQQGG